jgi:hypothetical protein
MLLPLSPDMQTAAQDAAITRAVDQATQQAITEAYAAAKAVSDQVAQGNNAFTIQPPPGSSPSAIYEGLVAARRVLRDQLNSLENKRDELAREIQRGTSGAGGQTGLAGLEARIKEMDARISVVDAQVAQANLAVARAASVPGAIVEKPIPRRDGPPEEVFVLAGVFMFVVLLPLTIAYARRLWKRGSTIIAPVPPDVRERLDGLTHAVEAIGIEVERIGEGQRFVTRVLAESRPVEHQLPLNRHVGVE